MLFTVKDIAAIVGIPQRRIQFYVDRGCVLPGGAVSTGRGVAHRFSLKNVAELYVVRMCASAGVALSVIRNVLAWPEHRPEQCIAQRLLDAAGERPGSDAQVMCVVSFASHEKVGFIDLIECRRPADIEMLGKFRAGSGEHAWSFLADQRLAPVETMLRALAGSAAAVVFCVSPVLAALNSNGYETISHKA
jgi:DNA-binding transcriptional MerR regulator